MPQTEPKIRANSDQNDHTVGHCSSHKRNSEACKQKATILEAGRKGENAATDDGSQQVDQRFKISIRTKT